MIIVQDHYRQRYKNKMSALKSFLNLETYIAFLQKLFLYKRKLCYRAFNFYLSG